MVEDLPETLMMAIHEHRAQLRVAELGGLGVDLGRRAVASDLPAREARSARCDRARRSQRRSPWRPRRRRSPPAREFGARVHDARTMRDAESRAETVACAPRALRSRSEHATHRARSRAEVASGCRAVALEQHAEAELAHDVGSASRAAPSGSERV
jgi:hypothetical protein